MAKIRILPRRAFRFETAIEQYTCVPGVIQDVDEKFTRTLMFKWAAKDGEIDVITSAVEQKVAENDALEGKPNRAKKSKADAR